MRYTPLELLARKTLKLIYERDGSTNERTNIRTDERKDENYIPLGINAGGIIIDESLPQGFPNQINEAFTKVNVFVMQQYVYSSE